MAIRFSVEELRARRDRIFTELENRGLYALRCYRQKTDFYLTGYDIFGYCFFTVSAALRRWANGFFNPGTREDGCERLSRYQFDLIIIQ